MTDQQTVTSEPQVRVDRVLDRWQDTPDEDGAPFGPPPDARSALDHVPGPVVEGLMLAGGLGQLAGDLLWKAIRHPKGYWRQTADEMYEIVRLCLFPLFLAVATFDVMVDVLGLNVLSLVGANNRYAEFFEYGSVREFSVWIMAMVVAGIVGSALCADLGARKVREELDALKVLGGDPVRDLVLPRVLATTFVTPMMLIFSTVTGLLCPAIGTQIFGLVPATDFLHNMFDDIHLALILGAIGESVLFGFVIGIVSAFKGMNCGSGSIGVGRAVNQAVVLIFVLVFVIDFIFMNILVGLNPGFAQLR